VAIVSVQENALMRDLKPAQPFDDVCKTKEAEELVLKSIGNASKNAKLKPFEMVKNVRLVHVEWTPEDGILSSAGKIKRNVVKERYEQEILAMYEQGERRF
jgi:long-chain acyl-CoA synthetase